LRTNGWRLNPVVSEGFSRRICSLLARGVCRLEVVAISERNEIIYDALTASCDALELKGESGTEDLFLIFSAAFSKANVKEMNAEMKASHKVGLGYNMLGPMADHIEIAMEKQLKSYIPPWNQ
jgi:hypothetical protein